MDFLQFQEKFFYHFCVLIKYEAKESVFDRKTSTLAAQLFENSWHCVISYQPKILLQYRKPNENKLSMRKLRRILAEIKLSFFKRYLRVHYFEIHIHG
jgi:hypothetical protein